MVKHILFILLMIAGGYYFWNSRPVVHGPGEVAPNKPMQQQVYRLNDIDYNEFKLSPFAKIDIEARLLSKKKYYEDREAKFSPYDFVLGWGPMSDERNLDKILIKQSDRFYHWEMIEPPIPVNEIRINSANVRLISSSQEISKKLKNLRLGQIIRIKGYLVEVHSKDGWSVRSSSLRTDTGKEASEIVWIKELSIL